MCIKKVSFSTDIEKIRKKLLFHCHFKFYIKNDEEKSYYAFLHLLMVNNYFMRYECANISSHILDELIMENISNRKERKRENDQIRKEIHQFVVHLSLSLAISYCVRRDTRVHILLACVDITYAP